MKFSDEWRGILGALKKAQSAVDPVLKGKTVKNGRGEVMYSYASAADVQAAVDAVLPMAGLICVASWTVLESHPAVVTRLIHTDSMQWVEVYVVQPPNSDGQKNGGLMSYGRKYGLCALLQIPMADSDDQAQRTMRQMRQFREELQRLRDGGWSDAQLSDRVGLPVGRMDTSTAGEALQTLRKLPDDAPAALRTIRCIREQMKAVGMALSSEQFRSLCSQAGLDNIKRSSDLTQPQADHLLAFLKRAGEQDAADSEHDRFVD